MFAYSFRIRYFSTMATPMLSMFIKRKQAAATIMLAILDEKDEELEEEKKYHLRYSRIGKLFCNRWLRKRNLYSYYYECVRDLRFSDELRYRLWLRMDEDTFKYLLELVRPLIIKKDTVMRLAIPADERLDICLRYLATGETFRSLVYCFQISDRGISKIVFETCAALYAVLKTDFVRFPETEQEWLNIAKRFEQKWQFPHCIGALDGKHIAIQRPAHSHSHYYNYKVFYSIVLLAIVDADLKFTWVDVGRNGRLSDTGVFNISRFYNRMEDEMLNLPVEEPLPGTQISTPYVLVADEIFGLNKHLMKPYAKEQLNVETTKFNYRLSRARSCVENAFGIIANRWRVLHTTILEPRKGNCHCSCNYCIAQLLKNINCSERNVHTNWVC